MYKIIKEQDESAQIQADKFIIDKIINSNDFILIEGHIHCKLYFAFYKNYIVCSGDYGEWVFDCTWDTIKDNKPIIPDSEYYLASKVSRDCKTKIFDEQLFIEELNEWYQDWREENKENKENIKNIKKVDELIENFYCDNEYRIANILDDFFEDFKELTNYGLDFEVFSGFGEKLNVQFLVNLKILSIIKNKINLVKIEEVKE